jgi:dTDP-4-amino-4,6-dideoxygalactose transaminase
LDSMINVTKTYLPPLEQYSEYLKKIWNSRWVTNYGPLVQELEGKLKEYLGVRHLFFVSNGTIALQIAIEALELKGEIITTPFSYVATTSAIAWQGKKPVFADIDPGSLCIDPARIREKITKQTSAILATHIYGNPCDTDAIDQIQKEYGLKVVYDAAHAFGVGYNGKSILQKGDISTISFHATKIFHTIEGGAIITQDDSLAEKISYMMNFGHDGEEKFFGLGINGKNSEFHAAMGLCLLPEMKKIIEKRKELALLYDQLLKDISIEKPIRREENENNYGYYPVIFTSEKALLQVRAVLNANNIFPRRYFYPGLNSLNYVDRQALPVADEISPRVLCLPLFYEMTQAEIRNVSFIIIKAFA